jgi:quercetin dioxygenase-like cupin family protein
MSSDIISDMNGKFLPASDRIPDVLDWGTIAWLNPPATFGTKHAMAAEVVLQPGSGHNFHFHPGQEEIIWILEGEVEQWLEREMRTMTVGDALTIAPDVVHASFNVSDKIARIFVVVGPCVGDDGYTAVDVSNEPMWKQMR